TIGESAIPLFDHEEIECGKFRPSWMDTRRTIFDNCNLSILHRTLRLIVLLEYRDFDEHVRPMVIKAALQRGAAHMGHDDDRGIPSTSATPNIFIVRSDTEDLCEGSNSTQLRLSYSCCPVPARRA